MLPTIADIVDLPVVRAGMPVVRAGRASLTTAVRWVHVSEVANPAGTLPAGVLLLSIGVVAADPTTDPGVYLAALADAGAVGLVIELGQHLQALPAGLVQAARAADFPLVELRRNVRFVEVAEAVLERILGEQRARTAFAQHVADVFHRLTVEGADVDRMVTTTAELLGVPVVLEDLGHRVLLTAASGPPASLHHWVSRSRRAPATAEIAAAGPEGWTVRPVGPRAQRWGRLVVPVRLASDVDPETARTVLDRAADAIAVLGLMGRADPATLGRAAQQDLLRDLLGGQDVTGSRARARAQASGLDTSGELSVAVFVAGTTGEQLCDAVVALLARTRRRALVGTVRADRVAIVVGHTGEGTAEIERIVRGLPVGAVVAAGVAEPAPFESLVAGLEEALFVADAGSSDAPARGTRICRRADLGARGLLWQLRDDPLLLSYVDQQLGRLLALEPRRRDRALETLTAHLESGGVVADLARRIGTSRPAAYARLRQLAEQLDADIDDPEVRLSLHMALVALRQTSAAG